jgi:hypothetical protein
MPDPSRSSPAPRSITPVRRALDPDAPAPQLKIDEKIACDRCGGDVYRMHAVWRCAACGFKSDCCGW